jgi:hypothetical protein
MLKRLFIIAAIGLAACTQAPAPVPTEESDIRNIENVSERVRASSDSVPEWVETEISGVEVGMWLPPGWQADTVRGLSVVEHMGSIRTNEPARGIVLHVFVPDLDQLLPSVGDSDNLAYAALEQVASSPEHTNGAYISTPVAFEWKGYPAAYYLYTTHDRMHGLVLALTTARQRAIVVTNVTASADDSERLPSVLPQILRDLHIDRQQLDDAFLAALPNPLMWPVIGNN